MSIVAMEKEIGNQVADLPNFAESLRDQKFLHIHPSKLVFSGSGDSFATALFAQELSGGTAIAADPYELSRKTPLIKGKHLVLISVSGKTRANLLLARKSRGLAVKRTAVTANPISPLGRACDEVITLKYRSAGKLTSGTASFTASLLVCSRILGKLPKYLASAMWMEKASEWARNLATSPNGDFLFMGSGVQYALGEYGACKMHEILGAKAEAQFPEQLGHARLFSINKESDVIVSILSVVSDKTRYVAESLQRKGFRVHTISAKSRDPVNRALEISFYLQQLALRLAQKRKMREVSFLSNRSRLQLSNQIIY